MITRECNSRYWFWCNSPHNNYNINTSNSCMTNTLKKNSPHSECPGYSSAGRDTALCPNDSSAWPAALVYTPTTARSKCNTYHTKVKITYIICLVYTNVPTLSNLLCLRHSGLRPARRSTWQWGSNPWLQPHGGGSPCLCCGTARSSQLAPNTPQLSGSHAMSHIAMVCHHPGEMTIRTLYHA